QPWVCSLQRVHPWVYSGPPPHEPPIFLEAWIGFEPTYDGFAKGRGGVSGSVTEFRGARCACLFAGPPFHADRGCPTLNGTTPSTTPCAGPSTPSAACSAL